MIRKIITTADYSQTVKLYNTNNFKSTTEKAKVTFKGTPSE